jgi:integrase
MFMKIDRHDQAKILSPDEISRLFTIGLKSARDRALFGVCLYTGTRIAEACSLHILLAPNGCDHTHQPTHEEYRRNYGE